MDFFIWGNFKKMKVMGKTTDLCERAKRHFLEGRNQLISGGFTRLIVWLLTGLQFFSH
ncbi:hypothetical protein [Chitinophaga sp. MM2321]|uniref:hypothetical protein n=1 Tax=Chitinophaga sp. MM2321 TaxID=3137178 RepID=UPI0032D59F76